MEIPPWHMIQKLCKHPQKQVKKEMVRNLFRYSDIVKFYFILVILLYEYAMLILRWCGDYPFCLKHTGIEKSYDSDDLPMNQMVLQQNS